MAVNENDPLYQISKADASILRGAVALPHDVRVLVLSKLCADRQSIIELFSQFIGMCLTLEKNNREMLELFCTTELGMHPHSVHQINLPTIAGALNGIGIAIEPVPGMCRGCAYRLGTCANQSPITSIDANDGADGEFKFNCHYDLDDDGEPTRVCAGWANLKAQRERNAE